MRTAEVWAVSRHKPLRVKNLASARIFTLTGMCFFDIILPESEKKSKLNMIPVTHLPIIRGCNIVFLNENVKKD